jgi:hypothetical protein
MENQTRPSCAYLLLEGFSSPPRKLTPEEMDTLFTRYEDTGWEPRLEEVRRLTGSEMIEAVRLPGLGTLWCDEEGLLRDRKVNPVASLMYSATTRTPGSIVGAAVLVPTDGADPEDVAYGVELSWTRCNEMRNAAPKRLDLN